MTKKVVALDLHSTEDYSIFQSLEGNRAINTAQVNRLANVVLNNSRFNYLNPIIVNEKLEVIDGQHRIEAFKKHQLKKDETREIFYLIYPGLTLKDARAINAGSKPWRPIDYAKAYALEGQRDYKTYLEFIDLYKLNHDITSRYLAIDEVSYNLNGFRDGDFRVKDEKLSHKLCEWLSEVGAFYPESIDHNDHEYKVWMNRGFALAFLKVAIHPRYSHRRMCEQMEGYARLLRDVPLKVTEMASALRQIYNRGQETKVDLGSN